MRSGLTFDAPADSQERGEDATGLWQLASSSSGVKRDVDELCRSLAMLEALGDDAEGERLDASDSLVAVLTVGHDASQRGHFGQPTAVVFSLDFNRERHNGNVPSGLAV
jgi:hypothetical protein